MSWMSPSINFQFFFKWSLLCALWLEPQFRIFKGYFGTLQPTLFHSVTIRETAARREKSCMQKDHNASSNEKQKSLTKRFICFQIVRKYVKFCFLVRVYWKEKQRKRNSSTFCTQTQTSNLSKWQPTKYWKVIAWWTVK